MYKLYAAILKDLRILGRDKAGLAVMFAMPVLLAIVITSVQNNTFELVNKNKVNLLVCNKDTGDAAKQLIKAFEKIGTFQLLQAPANQTEVELKERMNKKDALVAVVIPADFTAKTKLKAQAVSAKALKSFGLDADSGKSSNQPGDSILFYYHPVLQEAFRQSVQGGLRSAIQMVQSREILRSVYFAVNEQPMPDSMEADILSDQAPLKQIPVSRDGSRNIPNATQHNIPAWTVFAMFFVVISLSTNVVREKQSGSFVRLQTMPTNYLLALAAKQITYVLVTVLQAAVIFGIGIWLFPKMGLPGLNIPHNVWALLLVTIICGWCAVSYALCVGVFARTQEQANGFGAVSVILFAAVGGILVPSFVMPQSFKPFMHVSPLHWCLESYYGLFLEGGSFEDIVSNLIPLLAAIFLFQLAIVSRSATLR